MIGHQTAWRWLVTLAVAGFVAPGAQAQQVECKLCTGSDAAEPAARPIRLEVRSRLDFDSLVFAGFSTGQLNLDPNGTVVTTGGVSSTGARAMPGTVTVIGEPGRIVRVTLPGRVRLFGERGSLEIDSLITDLPAFPAIGPNGELTFRFGGNLKLEGDLDGSFRGDIDISVDYL